MRFRCLILLAAAAWAAVAATGCRKDEPATTQPAGKEQKQSASPAAAEPPMPTTLPQAGTDAVDAKHLAEARADINEGLSWLLKHRNADGGWGFAPGRSHPALTAMVLKVLAQHPDYGIESPAVVKGFASMMKFRQPDGGFYDPGEGNANYITSVAVMALAAAKDPRQREALDGAVRFLRGRQIVPGSKDLAGEQIGEKHPYVGGVSYGRPDQNRPDLSNVGFWMEALHEAGVSGDDPAVQRALAFVKRLQNRTEGTAGQAFVVRGADDGGFVYAVRRQGESFVGESMAGSDDRGLRSYGSMTYTGFKSMLYANVARNDPRVRAAYDWIRKYWRLDTNPNMPAARSRQGLYYYYHVFAKALRAWGQDVIPAGGEKHNWRHELIDALHEQQKADGSWINAADKWMESNSTLVTCHAVLALQEALKK